MVQVKQYAANFISENMYIQVDYDGYTADILDVIVDYSKDDTFIPIFEKYVTIRSGNRRLCHTTEGWHLLVRWKDVSEQWVPLKLLKEHNPDEFAEFSQSCDIYYEPAFCWWAAVNARVIRTSHNYGIEVPTSVDHAKRINASDINRLW